MPGKSNHHPGALDLQPAAARTDMMKPRKGVCLLKLHESQMPTMAEGWIALLPSKVWPLRSRSEIR